MINDNPSKNDIKKRRDEIRAKDPYWNQPLWYRIYIRLMCAIAGGIIVGIVFDSLNAPIIIQFSMAIVSGIGILMFRMAYPGGFNLFYNETMARVLEEAQQQQKKQK